MPVNLGAFAIVRNVAGSVLLCHRRDMDLWDLPGGKVEAGEAPWEAAIRETREEVGMSVEVQRLTDVTWKPKDDELVFTFECKLVGGTPELSDEADAIAYFDPDDLPANLSPAKRERILGFVAQPDRTRMRTRTAPSVRELLRRGEL